MHATQTHSTLLLSQSLIAPPSVLVASGLGLGLPNRPEWMPPRGLTPACSSWCPVSMGGSLATWEVTRGWQQAGCLHACVKREPSSRLPRSLPRSRRHAAALWEAIKHFGMFAEVSLPPAPQQRREFLLLLCPEMLLNISASSVRLMMSASVLEPMLL